MNCLVEESFLIYLCTSRTSFYAQYKWKKKKIKGRTDNSVQTFYAEIQFDCPCRKREMVGKTEFSKDGHSYTSHPTCSSFNMTFTPFIMQWGLCPFPLQGADLCDCHDNSIWQNWCHVSSEVASQKLHVLVCLVLLGCSFLESSYHALGMTKLGYGEIPWGGTKFLICILSGASPADQHQLASHLGSGFSSSQPRHSSWWWRVEQRWAIPSCPAQLMSQVNDYYCFQSLYFGLCYAGIDNQNI